MRRTAISAMNDPFPIAWLASRRPRGEPQAPSIDHAVRGSTETGDTGIDYAGAEDGRRPR